MVANNAVITWSPGRRSHRVVVLIVGMLPSSLLTMVTLSSVVWSVVYALPTFGALQTHVHTLAHALCACMQWSRTGAPARTPHLDAMSRADTAVWFQRAYSGNPICSPTRASLHTGASCPVPSLCTSRVLLMVPPICVVDCSVER